ncbi:p-aminobenzoyl-glutamate hydrolase subunit B [Alphaproteobacteria bacterium SO-S41]|nr:p-aminobenzoyl-glutamate hydrolase subunit B [Alphaproteobacteria bacterium SO-S41]
MDVEALKRDACAAIDAMRGRLLDVSHFIHANPELAFKEEKAAARLAAEVEHADLTVERGAFGVDTAFASTFGKASGPEVAILSEYDALPGIGHACGHNVIATIGLGASLGLAKLGVRLPGRVRYLGTPAEEAGGGKEYMAQRGAFDGLAAAMMVHSAGFDIETMPCIAVATVDVVYEGVPAHASAMPHRGINALDALVIAYQGIGALRQHIKQTERLHGIITEGGLAANIVPARAAGQWFVRAADAKDLARLKKRVEGCFQAGAFATGAKVDIQWAAVDYLDLRTNWPIARTYRQNAEALGRRFLEVDSLPSGVSGSTDMGNVSHRVPSIHPMIAVGPPDVVIHHPDFAAHAVSPMGDQAAIDGAKALAMTAIDIFTDAALRDSAQMAFESDTEDSRDALKGAFNPAGKRDIAGGCGCC